MKKLTILMAALFIMAGCGSSNETEKKGTAESAKNDKGDYATAEVTMKGDKVESIKLDETKEGKSKKELGSTYDMKSASKIGKEWDEQVKFLEDYIVKNGIDSVEVNEKGYPSNNDVLSGCTMNVKNLIDTAKEAEKNAK